MKKLLLILCLIILVGCNENLNNEQQDRIPVKENDVYYDVLTFDGCQYIYYKKQMVRGQTLAHKGNCNNPIHICK